MQTRQTEETVVHVLHSANQKPPAGTCYHGFRIWISAIYLARQVFRPPPSPPPSLLRSCLTLLLRLLLGQTETEMLIARLSQQATMADP